MAKCYFNTTKNKNIRFIMNAVEVKNISLSYNEVKAIDQVSFHIEPSEIFGIIGPDGAGKTSLFQVLTTLRLADEGTATVEGYDLVNDYREIRKIVGYMPSKFSLYQDLTIQENLDFFATIFNTTIEENYVLIKDIYEQIKPFSKRRAGKLSGGMKQKLALCCALIHKPKVLFLDEPTTGVDVVSRAEFWSMLNQLKTQGMSIVVSTPYMDEAKRCNRIALLQNGQIMEINTPQHIVANYPKTLFGVKGDNTYALLEGLRADSAVESCYAFGEYMHLTLHGNGSMEEAKALAQQYCSSGLEVQIVEPSIEDSFIRLMNQNQTKK